MFVPDAWSASRLRNAPPGRQGRCCAPAPGRLPCFSGSPAPATEALQSRLSPLPPQTADEDPPASSPAGPSPPDGLLGCRGQLGRTCPGLLVSGQEVPLGRGPLSPGGSRMLGCSREPDRLGPGTERSIGTDPGQRPPPVTHAGREKGGRFGSGVSPPQHPAEWTGEASGRR